MKKRVFCILLAVCLYVTVLAGCESSGGAAAPAAEDRNIPEITRSTITADYSYGEILYEDAYVSLSFHKLEIDNGLFELWIDVQNESGDSFFAQFDNILLDASIEIPEMYVQLDSRQCMIKTISSSELDVSNGNNNITVVSFNLNVVDAHKVDSNYSYDSDAVLYVQPFVINLPSAASDNQGEGEDVVEPIEAADIEWTDVSYTTTDTDGYVYEITLKVSPWILLSNTDIVNSAWSEVGKSNTLPGFNSWSLRQDSLGTYFRQGLSNGNSTSYFAFNMSDMYYCVGTAQITNITEGWSIDASSPRSLYFGLQWVSSFDKSAYAGVYAIGRVFYSNETTDGCNGLAHSAKMTSDHWGPVSFVIMAPENFSPNYPDGEHPQHMLDGFFRYYDNGEAKEVHIGVIGKNGLYTPSISVETDG